MELSEKMKLKAIREKAHNGYRIYIGDMGKHIGRKEITEEFRNYGPIDDIWVARWVYWFLQHQL